MKKLFSLIALLMLTLAVGAQRTIDKLDRGLIAMKTTSGIYVNWRVQSDEYYDVTYNIYRDGSKLNAEPLKVSNYTDKDGSLTSKYTVRAIVKGVEQAESKPATPWSTSYKEITLKHEGIASTLVPNDACCADVDGDGELEILLKFDNADEAGQSYPKAGPVINGKATGEYSIFEVLKLDGTRLWWVNCGPNMGDFQNNEQNIVGYDWDLDGKAEVVMRLLEGSTVHYADGKTYQIGANGQNGSSWTNYRAATGGGTNWFMHDGKEFLVYCNGQTGEILDLIDFPLARLESGETDLNKAWGDGYGHRSNKFFFGAPYLDGRKPSIFLARGIYTRHKMAALDVNPSTHKLSIRWKWYNNTGGPWKGQGYHNYAIADVDMDGRDEIVFGSMVIDDNGKGLSTAGLGHGDAQHCGDLNPYAWGLEQFCCNEDEQGFNYRDATTSKLYAATLHVGKDVGRAMAGNFTESYPGGLGTAYGDISTVTNGPVSGLGSTGVNANFCIYWDGDLVQETFNYLNGKNTEGCVAKYGSWTPIYTCAGSMTNNDTKGTPCYQGDILGDWREEIIMRTPNNNIRIYSTPTKTDNWNYSLWYDHQYRNAMVWQMCGYNQPPHTSYFLGKLEGITLAPPPLTMLGRKEVANGGTISGSESQIVCETNNTSVTLAQGATPDLLVFNVPSWTQGSGASECTAKEPKITTVKYTCDVTGGGLGDGPCRLVKQGEGILNLPVADFLHSGNTDIWGGILNFNGTMKNSALLLERFTTLNANATFKSIQAKYASTIRPGGENAKGVITTEDLNLGMGARLVVDLYSDGLSSDCIKTGDLTIEAKTTSVWKTAGPTYLTPVIEIVGHYLTGETSLTPGKYVIAEISGEVTGNVANIILEGEGATKKSLYIEDGKLIVEITGMRDAGAVVWTGATNTNWDFAESENFSLNGEPTFFVQGDAVTFNDDATVKGVNVIGSLLPASFTVNNTADYTIGGEGGIDGTASFTKEGTGTVTMSTPSTYTGGNYLKGGTTVVSLLANDLSAEGNLGGVTTSAAKFTMENGAVLKTTAEVTQKSPMKMVGTEGGVIDAGGAFHADGAVSGTLLTKRGSACLHFANGSGLTKLALEAGSIAVLGGAQPATVEIVKSGTIYDDAQNTTRPIVVAEKATGAWHLSYSYYTEYANKLTGKGTLTIVPRNSVNRVRIDVRSWTGFEGTIKHNTKIWLPLKYSADCSKMTLDLAADCGAAMVPGNSMTIGAVTGKGNLENSGCDFNSSAAPTGNVAWSIGNSLGKDFEWGGRIIERDASRTCSFNKVGTCTMTMSGTTASNMSGAVGVNAGTLILSQPTAEGILGIGTLTIKSGATMAAACKLTNSSYSVQSGGKLYVGKSADEATSGDNTLDVNGKNVTIATGGIIHLSFSGTASSASKYNKIANVGTFTLNGTLEFRIKTSATNVSKMVGKEFQVVSANKITMGSNAKLDLDPQYDWDTSTFTTDGKIRITQVNAVTTIDSESEEISNAYTIDGVYVGRPTKEGIYIVNGQKVYVK